MDLTGPTRRKAERRRPAKPYAKLDKPVVASRSSFSSLLGIFTAPFRKATSVSENSSNDERNTSNHESESSEDGEAAAKAGAPSRHASEARVNVLSAAANTLTGSGRQIEVAKWSMDSPLQAPQRPSGNESMDSSTWGRPQGFNFSNPKGTWSPTPSNSQPAAFNEAPSTPTRPDSSVVHKDDDSPYKDILDFLHTKRTEKLNSMEIIGLTQSLRKNATGDAREIVDYIEAASNVPSAALLGSYKPSLLASSPNTPRSTNKPFLAPVTLLEDVSSSSSPVRRRRRNLYTGVGQSPRKAGSPGASTVSLIPRIKLLQPEAPSLTSNKKRLVGYSGIPVSSGASTSSSRGPVTSSVPFPLTSPAKPQRAAAPKTPIPPVSGDNTISSNGVFAPRAVVSPIPPVKPRNPSPLRHVTSIGESSSPPESDERRPRKSDPNHRSQASAAIFDIIMDASNPLPPSKPKAIPELKNPFERMHPTPPRVSTPVQRKTSRLSRPWSPASSPAPIKRELDSDNILDQIDSTAPNQSAAAKKQRLEQSDPSASTSASQFPAATEQITTFRASARTTNSQFGLGLPSNIHPTRASKLSPPIQPPSVASTSSALAVRQLPKSEAPTSTKPSMFHAQPYALSPQKASKKQPEIIVIDDDEEDEFELESQTPQPLSAQRLLPSSGPTKPSATIDPDTIMIEELDDDYGDEEGEGSVDGNRRSRSPSTTPSPTKGLQPTSVEENDDGSRNPGDAKGSNSYSRIAALGKKSYTPSPLRHVSLPPSEHDIDEDELVSSDSGDELVGNEKENGVVVLGTMSENDRPRPVFGDASFHPKAPFPSNKSLALQPPSAPSSTGESAEDRTKNRALGVPLQDLTPYDILHASTITELRSAATSSFISLQATTNGFDDVRNKAAAIPIDELLVYSMRTRSLNDAGGGDVSALTAVTNTKGLDEAPADFSEKAAATAPKSTTTTPAAKHFDWAAAGVAKPAVSDTDQWTCNSCMCKSPLSASKCTVCDEPRSGVSSPAADQPNAAPPALAKSFDWSPAGLAQPVASTTGEWTCGSCMCKSPARAVKCSICEEPRPGSVSLPVSFDWTAAGMTKPATSDTIGKWACSVCMISNDAVRVKCAACGADRP